MNFSAKYCRILPQQHFFVSSHADKPTDTSITIEPATAVVGESVTITCESFGHPEPVITIKKNGTNVVFTSKKHTIHDVKKHDAATYKCVAENKLGIDSKSAPLNVKGKILE